MYNISHTISSSRFQRYRNWLPSRLEVCTSVVNSTCTQMFRDYLGRHSLFTLIDSHLLSSKCVKPHNMAHTFGCLNQCSCSLYAAPQPRRGKGGNSLWAPSCWVCRKSTKKTTCRKINGERLNFKLPWKWPSELKSAIVISCCFLPVLYFTWVLRLLS